MSTAKTIVEYSLTAILLILVVSLIFGYILGQPALLAYVESGSMEPTLNEGDGFVAIPAALAGDIDQGDVVMFEAEMIHGGDLTTHRVVDVRETGYITQGDANPFTDQSRDEPAVTDGQIKAVALQINGDVLRIPHLGTGVMALKFALNSLLGFVAGLFGLQQLGTERSMYLLFGFGILLYGWSFFVEDTRSRTKSRKRRGKTRDQVFSTNTIIAVFVAVLLIVATLSMVLPAGTHTFGIVSSQSNPDRPTVVPVGGSSEMPFPTGNGGYIPVVTYFEPASTGVDVEPTRMELSPNESMNATITFHAPDETGYYVRSVKEYRYLVIIPPSLIDRLYHVHPWLPYIAINGVLGTALIGIGLFLSNGSDKVRFRSRNRSRPGGIFDWL